MRPLLGLLLILVTILPEALANTLDVPASYPAIHAAADGDIVLAAPGTYVERINFKGKAILVTSSGGANVTTIDGNLNGPVVTFATGETSASVLSGFTITHGMYSGGISCSQTQ